MKFSDIAGQTVISESLRRAVTTGKVSNAYIFHGAAGSGRKLAASIFAAALNCISKSYDVPCCACSSCIRSRSGNHPNLRIIRPSGSSIKIKQIWEVINEVSKKSVEEGYKIIILEEAEKMTDEAQNAFLKTLEEPTPDTVFILVVENLNLLLPTIQSRCQTYNFLKLDENLILTYLKERYDYPESKLKAAAAASDGTIGKALKILSDEDYLKKLERYIKVLQGINADSRSLIAALTEDIIEKRSDASDFIAYITSFFRDVMIYKELNEKSESMLLNSEILNEIMKYSEILTNEDINCIMDIINNTRKQVDFNVSFKNSIDSMLFGIMEVNRNGKGSRDQI